MTGTRQHFIPAAAIGRFSTESQPTPPRDRLVWVRRRNGTIHQQRASSVAFQNNLYNIGDIKFHKPIGPPSQSDNLIIDEYWQSAEGAIWPGLAIMMADGPRLYNANAWAQVARYISTLFARSPDFHRNFRRRFTSWDDELFNSMMSYEMTNAARPIENQRVMSAVLRASWDVVVSDEAPLIINDRGMTTWLNTSTQLSGYVFPLMPGIAMALSRGPYDKLITWTNGAWRIDVPTHYLDREQARSLNVAAWRQCRREVYSGVRKELEILPDAIDGYEPPQDEFDHAILLGLSRKERMAAEWPGLMLTTRGLPEPKDLDNPPIITI